MYIVSQLFIYPVKSLGGIEVASAQLTDRGFEYDRRWMLVNAEHRFLTQREYPLMSLLQTEIVEGHLVIFRKDNMEDKLILALHPKPAATHRVKVWDDECQVQFVDNAADEWLSRQLSIPCRLVYMPDHEKRKVDQAYALSDEITSLSDGYPLLMIGQASLDDLNRRLAHPLPVDRFRPNIVFTGGHPYDEDIMAHISINGIDLYGVKLCARCAITTIDQTDASKGKEPLKTLAGYRTARNNIYFGQNVLFGRQGRIKIGESIGIVKTRELPVFNQVNSTVPSPANIKY